jgi:tetratricopeptide (TPR) repeat protein
LVQRLPGSWPCRHWYLVELRKAKAQAFVLSNKKPPRGLFVMGEFLRYNMNTVNAYRYYILGLVVIVIGVASYFLLGTRAAVPTGTPLTAELSDVQVTGDATIRELPQESFIPQPSLDRSVEIEASTLTPETQKVIQAKIATAVAAIKKTPNNLSLWMELGFRRKQLGDYVGAAEAWVYVNTLAKEDEISAINLGDLYMNFIKDYPKAELYYKKGLSANPKNIDTYNNLHTLYRYLYKTDTNAAANIATEALRVFPDQGAYIASW